MRRVCILMAFALMLLVPRALWAQASGIAGLVRDTSGAVMPGVTVEAASPALIEKVRTVVTDEKGAYRFVDLRPGTYSVTFTLPGFSGVKREGIELTAGFTAPVDAEMKVGSVEETLTVTGVSPIVDVTNVKTQNNLTRAVLDVVPNAQTVSSFSALTLGSVASGVTSGSDVGGAAGEQGMVSIHRARTDDMKYNLDGMNTNNSMGTNGGIFKAGQNMNQLAVSEVQVTYNAGSAEIETAGATFNFVTKDGGNRFSGSGRALFANQDMQSSNLTTKLFDRGARSAQSVKEVSDYGFALGGPIVQDKLWFFTAHRRWVADQYVPNSYYNAVQGTGRYQADLSKPGFYISHTRENGGRLTLQASSKDKIGYYGSFSNTCSCIQGVGATVAPEATLNNLIPNALNQISWTRVQNAKLLFEAGYTNLWTSFRFPHTAGPVDYSVSATDIPTTELSTGFSYNARAATSLAYTDFPESYTDPAGQQNFRGAVSYVTGSHSFKVGGNAQFGGLETTGQVNQLPGFGPVAFRLLNGAPNTVVLYMSPQYQKQSFRNVALYAQDQWTLQRLTLNYGVRADMFTGSYPDQDIPSTPFVPGFRVTARSGVPSWKTVSPRMGAAYRLTDDGKNALKVAVGRYAGAAGAGFVQGVNPANSIVTTATRNWGDADGDFFPDANELGPISNTAFGTSVVNNTFTDNVLTKNRPYTWQASAVYERELAPGWGFWVGYFRNQNLNYYATQNAAVASSGFTSYCVTAPVDSRLPGGGGNQICGAYDVNPASFGRVQNVTEIASEFGANKDVFNGIDTAIRARFGA